MKNAVVFILGLAAALTVLLFAASQNSRQTTPAEMQNPDGQTAAVETAAVQTASEKQRTEPGQEKAPPAWYAPTLSLDVIPPYAGDPYVVMNGNTPYFTAEDLTTESFERYSPLDSLGRCGTAFANVSEVRQTNTDGEPELLPAITNTLRRRL